MQRGVLIPHTLSSIVTTMIHAPLIAAKPPLILVFPEIALTDPSIVHPPLLARFVPVLPTTLVLAIMPPRTVMISLPSVALVSSCI